MKYRYLNSLLNELQDYIAPMQLNGHVMAILDCIICFANNALQYKYKKPQLHNGFELDLKGSRHPVIERNLPQGESYIPNDIFLDPQTQQVIILTGPNMSGKSAILRQTALITLMAHMGSFVPAEEAKIPLTDKIFTRVGANDNLSSGESTFMVEMNETASIINNITSRSLYFWMKSGGELQPTMAFQLHGVLLNICKNLLMHLRHYSLLIIMN